MRQRRDHPGVAALFLGLAQLVAGPPGDGVPPINYRDEQFEKADEMVAAAIVGQFVEEESLALAVVETMPKGHGDEELGAVSKGPQHGAKWAGEEVDGWRARNV